MFWLERENAIQEKQKLIYYPGILSACSALALSQLTFYTVLARNTGRLQRSQEKI